jgi:DNA modification methylase
MGGCNKIYGGDAAEVLRTLPAGSADCCITSPPYYGLRDYGVAGQLGMEATPEEYVARLAAVLAEVRRVLKPAGTLWLNLGDSYAGSA